MSENFMLRHLKSKGFNDGKLSDTYDFKNQAF